jgi:hypothetical protein
MGAQRRRLELVAAAERQGVGLLAHRQVPFLTRHPIGDHDPLVDVHPFRPDEMLGEGRYPGDEPAFGMGAPVAPVGARRVGFGRFDQLEIDRAVGVGANDEAPVPVLDIVADAGLARRHDAGRRRRILPVHQPGFAGLLVGARDHDVAA